jgi:hypothetical protein
MRYKGGSHPFHEAFLNVTVAGFGRICSMLGSISVTILSFCNVFVKKLLNSIFHFPLICRMKNCDFRIRSRNQKKRSSMLFDRLALMVSVVNPSATVMPRRIDDACWGYPSSVGCCGTGLLSVHSGSWKAAPNSVSAADVTTHDMILLVQ